MYRNIVFDMGNVLLRFEPDVFLEAVGVPEADRLLLKRNVYQSLDWARMDRGSMDEAAAGCRKDSILMSMRWWISGTGPYCRWKAWKRWSRN